MKKILALTLFLFSSSFWGATDIGNIAILVKMTPHLKVSMMTLSQMEQGKKPLRFNQASIIICGKNALASIKKDSPLKDKIMGLSKKITIKACAISMKKAGVKRSDLLAPVVVVENGLYELIRLRNTGYQTYDL